MVARKSIQVFIIGFLIFHFVTGNISDECLILTPFIKNGNITLARTLAEVNRSSFEGIESYSGYITVKEQFNSNLFFWFFPHHNGMADTPWIIWLQGGPGYSSLKGLFDLIGPIEIQNGQVTLRKNSWAKDYSLLFLDNPVGTGFSFTEDESGYTDNEDDVGDQMFEFLSQFLKLFTELQEAPLFIAGESYAGKYVPALGIQIHRHRKQDPRVNLKGIMIGNGLIDPVSMMHYSDTCRVFGILDDNELEELKRLEQSVVTHIEKLEMVDAANAFNHTIEYIKKQSGVGVYNFLSDPDSSPPEFERYLAREDVRKWIHVGKVSFDLDNQHVYDRMLPDIMNTTKPWLEELLEHYGVINYSGQLDIILAYSHSKYMYSKLRWSRREEYMKAPRKRLRSSSSSVVVGYRKAGGNFEEVLIRNAGHMATVEKPDVTKYIIDSFINKFK